MKNMGTVDRIIRAVVGAALVVVGIAVQAATGSLWWLIIPGAVLLLTAAVGVCPLYLPFKISTLKKAA